MKTQKLLLRLTVVSIAIVSLLSASIPDIKNYVKFSGNLFALQHEVTNKEYRDFLLDLKANNQNDKYAKCLYDSIQWIKKFTNSINKPNDIFYHSHPAYDNYPIININILHYDKQILQY